MLNHHDIFLGARKRHPYTLVCPNIAGWKMDLNEDVFPIEPIRIFQPAMVGHTRG